MQAVPFRVSIPKETLNDLQARLAQARWPDELVDSGWERGTPLSYLKELTDYWKNEFDWRAQEKALNRFSHYQATVSGLKIHFIHERGKGANPKPLLLTHGWPSTFFEMTKVIPLLVEEGFDVIVPSLPGFGFSQAPTRAGLSSWKIAELWMQLMTETLGYSEFFAHGGDVGSGVTTRLAILFPDRLKGIHLTAVADPVRGADSRALSENEERYLAMRSKWHEEEGAYWHQQRTRPQSLTYGLNDSPVGLAAWIVEKVRAWSDCNGNLESRFTKDELLTNLTLYWATQTIGSSMRVYFENWGPGARLVHEREKIRVPTSIALTTEKSELVPREWVDRLYDVKRWTEFPRGGHFMAFEEPELLVKDLCAAFNRRNEIPPVR